MATQPERVPTGTPGLDEVLYGGLLHGQTAVVSGGPGTGKTVLALQFLAQAAGTGLYIGFEEREADIRRNATGVGIDLSDVEVLDLSADGERFFENQEYTVFPTEEVEGEELLGEISAAINKADPDRLVVDPLSELRALLPDDFRFRRNISSLVNEMKERGVTTLCTTQSTDGSDRDLQFLGDAVIEVEYVSNHRSLAVTKFRGSDFANGPHTYRIHDGTGGRVYPKLVPGEFGRERQRGLLSSGVAAFDDLLGGGIETGSVTVISGPSGVGKTTTGSQFLASAAVDGTRAVCYLFEELREDYLHRADQLGLGIRELTESGPLDVREVESLTRSPDEFAWDVRQAVESTGVELVMIDGLPGYRLGLRGDDDTEALTRGLHALGRYCKRMGVTLLLVDEVRNVTGDLTPTDERISYLADNIVFLRYVERNGEIGKVVGVLKKRFGKFERSLRELTIDEGGIQVGDRLTGLRGILTGVPERVDGG